MVRLPRSGGKVLDQRDRSGPRSPPSHPPKSRREGALQSDAGGRGPMVDAYSEASLKERPSLPLSRAS